MTEIKANCLTKADKIFEEEHGIDPVKDKNIAVTLTLESPSFPIK